MGKTQSVFMPEKLIIEGHTGYVNQIILTNTNEEFITISSDFIIRIWDFASHSLKKILKGHTEEVNSISISNDDRLLVSGSNDKTIRLWNLIDYTEEIFIENYSFVVCVDVSKDKKYVAGGCKSGKMGLWNLQDKKVLLLWPSSFSKIYGIKFTSDSDRLIIASSNSLIKVCKVSEKSLLYVFDSQDTFASYLSLTENDKYIITCHDQLLPISLVQVWNLPEERLETLFHYYKTNAKSLTTSFDSKYALIGLANDSIQIWSLVTKALIRVLVLDSACKQSLAITKDNKTILASGKQGVALQPWSKEQKQKNYCLNAEGSSVNCLALTSNNSLLISGHNDYTVKMWNFTRKTQVGVLQGHTGAVFSLSILPDNKKVLSSSADATIRVWDIIKKTQIAMLKSHYFSVYCIYAYHNSPYAISGSKDTTIIIWDLETYCAVKVLQKHTSAVFSLDLMKNDKIAISGEFNGAVILWDLIKKEFKHKLNIYWIITNILEINQDDTLVLIGSKSAVIVWDIKNNKETDQIQNLNTKCIKSFSYKKCLVTGNEDASIRIWDLNNGKNLHHFAGHSDKITSLVLTNDDKIIISGSLDGSIFI